MSEIIEKGGPLIYPLLFCSVVTLAIIFERVTYWCFLKKNESAIKRGHRILETMVSIGPGLGILGTIVGIIQSFDSLTTSGQAGMDLLSKGISQALWTTCIGLALALFGQVFLNLFEFLAQKHHER